MSYSLFLLIFNKKSPDIFFVNSSNAIIFCMSSIQSNTSFYVFVGDRLNSKDRLNLSFCWRSTQFEGAKIFSSRGWVTISLKLDPFYDPNLPSFIYAVHILYLHHIKEQKWCRSYFLDWWNPKRSNKPKSQQTEDSLLQKPLIPMLQAHKIIIK